MATLSGQTIQSTYQGLLKLADSTTGITNSIQVVEDGLGNDTGLKIKSNFLIQSNQSNLGIIKNNFYGIGIVSGTVAGTSASHNVIWASTFYDKGIYEYSAITLSLTSATTIGDTFEMSFYTSDMGPNGLYAKDLIISGKIELKDWEAASEKIFKCMVKLDKSLE